MAKTNTSVSIEWRLFQYRFVVLFGVLISFLIVPPLLNATGLVVRIIPTRMAIVVLFSMTLLAAVFAVSRGRMAQIVGILLAVPAIILLGMNALLERAGFVVPSYGFAILFLGYTLMVLLKYLFAASQAKVNTICAALSVYLLLGVLWVILCSLLDVLAPGSYATTLSFNSDSGVMRFGNEYSLYSIYYSFVTMTALGSGDITPVLPAARMFAAIEVVMGQLCLVVLVARLVGLHVAQSLQKST